MAVGDQNDFLLRLKAVLPQSWFPLIPSGGFSAVQVLEGLLSGFAWMLAQTYALLAYVAQQTRIGTATDIWLDLASRDYLGLTLPRKTNEPDATYRARIKANLFPQLQTRAAIIAALTALTGRAPTIFMPKNTGDTGAYNIGTRGYGVAGAYGSLLLPFQFFVTAYRQKTGGIANVAGYNSPAGGYGLGAIEYATLALAGTQVQDAEIYATVARVEASGTTGWVRIES